MGYSFKSLSYADFEDLARDLIGRRDTIRFEAFGPGPDGGIDGRHTSNGKIILQAKHYEGSSFSALKAEMRRERASIDTLSPDRYILVTSFALSPANKAALAEIIGPSLRDQRDIVGATEINALLREFPKIERAHIKLWLSGEAVLSKVLHAAASAFNETVTVQVEAKVQLYAQNPSFEAGRKIVEENHVLIISGPPGVGKTTLAEMLAYSYLAEDWNLVAIRSLDDGFAAISDHVKQIFFFDDFLGTIALDAQALSAKDSELTRFLSRVRRSSNARFILTTRAYILEDARRMSEHLADDRIQVSKYVLDVGVYTRQIKARILYNHLVVAGTAKALVRALFEAGAIKAIVDHKNFNPRVIEWMTDAFRLRGITAVEYPSRFLEALNSPFALWDVAFKKHIAPRDRHLLIAVFFSSEFGVDPEVLRQSFETIHVALSTKYGLARDPKDFEEALKTLEGGFITLEWSGVRFVNPSLRDYLATYLTEIDLLETLASAARRIDWAISVWEYRKKLPGSEAELATFALHFLPIAERFANIPTYVPDRRRAGYVVANDSSNSTRLEQLIEWKTVTSDKRFYDLALRLATNPPSGFDSWRDGAELVELVNRLRDSGYDESGNNEALAEAIEDSLVNLLGIGMQLEDLESVSDRVEEYERMLSATVIEAMARAIERHLRDMEDLVRDVDSKSTLDDYEASIRKLAPRASVSRTRADEALSTIWQRALQLDESTVVSKPGSVGHEPERFKKFDDDALANLFAPLLKD